MDKKLLSVNVTYRGVFRGGGGGTAEASTKRQQKEKR